MGKLVFYRIVPTQNFKISILVVFGVFLIALSSGCSTSRKFDPEKAAMYKKAENDLKVFLRSDHTERCEPVSSMELDFTVAKPDEYGLRNVFLQHPSYLGESGGYHEYIINFCKIGNGDGKTLSSSAEAIIYTLFVFMDNTGIHSNISPAVKLRFFIDQERKECIFLPISITDPAMEKFSYRKGRAFELICGLEIRLGYNNNEPDQSLTVSTLLTYVGRRIWKRNKIRSISSEFVPQRYLGIVPIETTVDLDGEKTKYTISNALSSLHSFNLEIRKPEQESIND